VRDVLLEEAMEHKGSKSFYEVKKTCGYHVYIYYVNTEVLKVIEKKI